MRDTARPTTTCADLAEEHQVWAWMAEMWTRAAENYRGALAITAEGHHLWSGGICYAVAVLRLSNCITPNLCVHMLGRVKAELGPRSYLAPFCGEGARVRAAFCACMAQVTKGAR